MKFLIGLVLSLCVTGVALADNCNYNAVQQVVVQRQVQPHARVVVQEVREVPQLVVVNDHYANVQQVVVQQQKVQKVQRVVVKNDHQNVQNVKVRVSNRRGLFGR